MVVAWRKGSWREFWAGALATALPVLLIAGWWYLRNVQLYGDVTGISAFIDVLGKRAAPASSFRAGDCALYRALDGARIDDDRVRQPAYQLHIQTFAMQITHVPDELCAGSPCRRRRIDRRTHGIAVHDGDTLAGDDFAQRAHARCEACGRQKRVSRAPDLAQIKRHGLDTAEGGFIR